MPMIDDEPIKGRFFKVFTLKHGKKEVDGAKVLAVVEPLDEKNMKIFWKMLSRGFMPIGRMSYMTYPKYIDTPGQRSSKQKNLLNPRFQDIMKTFVGWFHFADEPEEYLDPKVPRIMLPNSDTEWAVIDKVLGDKYVLPKLEEKIYDVMIQIPDTNSTQDNIWIEEYKNWNLAVKCMEQIIEKTNLTIFLSGKKIPSHLNYTDRIHWEPYFDKFYQFANFFDKVKVVLITATSDASPRIITQALFLNATVVVNNNIIGGKHYINDQTGGIFQSENDVAEVLTRLLDKYNKQQIDPRSWYQEFQKDKNNRIQSFIWMLREQNWYDYDDYEFT
ncbi:UNKNOWN [Stylonychia lemnae]|uniref:Glycosyl transferase family 1 domain-containing protein n=1 Tax=Stylonychia lemnae TaxID=5949 RepID=A0A078ACF4_STYLE|nr:UNKNOWN [Stylonychia lemnae]|eukprot:CDW79277.1 UNKNOWN [Stylonychia lemnae]